MSSKLDPGAKAPTFTLPQDSGGTVSLGDFAGRKLVLYFYPKADTPGCTKEAIDFSRLKAAFAKFDTDILGVSADPVAAQDKFKSKHKLAITLASDEKHRMLEAYGVWQEKSMYGRKFMGVVRATFLIGPNQRIAQVWPKVSVKDTPRRCWLPPRRYEGLGEVSRTARPIFGGQSANCRSIYPSPQNVSRSLRNFNHTAL